MGTRNVALILLGILLVQTVSSQYRGRRYGSYGSNGGGYGSYGGGYPLGYSSGGYLGSRRGYSLGRYGYPGSGLSLGRRYVGQGYDPYDRTVRRTTVTQDTYRPIGYGSSHGYGYGY